MDFSQFQEDKKANSRKGVKRTNDYQMRIFTKGERVQVSESLFNQLDLTNHGFSSGKLPDGTIVLTVKPSADSIFFKGKAGKPKKTMYKNSVFVNHLIEAGIVNPSTKITYVNLNLLGEEDGIKYYGVVLATPTTSSSTTTATSTSDSQPENVHVDAPVTNQPEANSEEESF